MLFQPTFFLLFLISAVAAFAPRNTLRSDALARRQASRSTGNDVKADDDVYRKRQATRDGINARNAIPRDMRPRASIAPATMCGSAVAGTPYRIMSNSGQNTFVTTSPDRGDRLTPFGTAANSVIFIFNQDCTLTKQGSTGGERLSVNDDFSSGVMYQAPSGEISLVCSAASDGAFTCVPQSPTRFNLAEFRVSPAPSNQLTFYSAGTTIDSPVTLTVVPA